MKSPGVPAPNRTLRPAAYHSRPMLSGTNRAASSSPSPWSEPMTCSPASGHGGPHAPAHGLRPQRRGGHAEQQRGEDEREANGVWQGHDTVSTVASR